MDRDENIELTRLEKRRARVAIVGSGMAGQVIAHLLQNDPQERYVVEMFESGDVPSLAAASARADGASPVVDIPMRTFTGGYYRNLVAMYDHLHIPYHEQTFRFIFTKHIQSEASGTKSRQYFVQSSNAQGILSEKPAEMRWIDYYAQLAYIALALLWLTLSFWLIADPRDDETFEAYLKRWRAPRRFAHEYLVPLLSGIATCSHNEILQFPARDIVRYRREVKSQRQYLVTGGVKMVQDRLMANVTLHTHARVSSVKPGLNGVAIHIETVGEDGQSTTVEQSFDEVILAVSPDVAASLFQPARAQLSQIPVRTVDTVVRRSDHTRADGCDDILLETFTDKGWTEATHRHHTGLDIMSCVQDVTAGGSCVSKHQFTRALRTPASRKIVQTLFQRSPMRAGQNVEGWSNGDQHVWMVGAWCWDGMVLLEGAVVSAMRVAQAFGVTAPWEKAGTR